MKNPTPSPVGTWLSVVRAFYLCDALMSRRLAALGIRTVEHEVLANLRSEPGVSQQTLAARCFSAKSHISGVVNDLERRGLLRRQPDPADARAKRLFLTPAGAEIARRTVAVQSEVVRMMTQGFSTRDMVHVEKVMNRLSETLEQEQHESRDQTDVARTSRKPAMRIR